MIFKLNSSILKNSMNLKLNKIFNAKKIDSKSDLKFFVKHGFVVYRNVFKKNIFDNVRENIFYSYNNLVKNYKKKKNYFKSVALVKSYRISSRK